MKYILALFIAFMISGCTIIQKNTTKDDPTTEKFSFYQKNEAYVSDNLNKTIIDIADQLFATKSNNENEVRVILTSFVNLDKLEETNTFGRLLSESMYNELHVRKFKVTDFRGQDAVDVNSKGEFHITRDTDKLKDSISGIEYILVGTYVKFENQSLLINARILDSISGDIVSSARVVYQPRDCKLFGICENIKKVEEVKYDIYQTQTNEIKSDADEEYNIVSDDKK